VKSRRLILWTCVLILELAALATTATVPGRALAGQRVALRTLTCIEEFDDASDVFKNNYRHDIDNAFKQGLIVGKVSGDGQTRYYDPNALITVGEMANIVARNYGAPIEVVGTDAVAYLNRQGIILSGPIGAPITVSQLRDIGAQTATRPGKVDLAVLRDAVGGKLSTDLEGGITRGHAVEVYRPPVTASATSSSPVANQPAPAVAGPPQAENPPRAQPTLAPPPPPIQTLPPPPAAVTQVITVTASVGPDPVRAGATAVVTATTNLPARRVSVKSPWGGGFELVPTGGLSWRGKVVVPVAASDGPHVFEVTAFGEWNTAFSRPVCNVAGSILDENTCVISD